MPTYFGGAEQGLLSTPVAGTIVDIAFAYGRSERPFIRTILGYDWSLPDFKPGEQLQQQCDEVFERIAGQKLIETLGSFEVMTGDDITLGSLANMHLVNSGDHVKIIGQLRDIVIGLNDQLTVLKDRIHTIEQNDTLTINGQQTITIKKDQVIKVKNIKQDGDTIKLNGGTGVITCASICPFTSSPHVDGSTTVFAGK